MTYLAIALKPFFVFAALCVFRIATVLSGRIRIKWIRELLLKEF